ncbi:DinB family protein [Chishuiella sp.]|uniref:DinB family protein n=1 Tax=Chishuiella sp. TaxID=1969467 RepID=UPI0028A5F1A2|nr:DinB family protein [Chishuiella sp.]
MQDIQKLKYPIGKFEMPKIIDKEIIDKWIHILEEFPEKIKAETENLSEIDLEKQYRPDGWTIRQVVHHCADSHMNSIIRFKLALTEDIPTIKLYSENLWADIYLIQKNIR